MRGFIDMAAAARVTAAAVFALGLCAATPGRAARYEVGRVVIIGNKSVPTAALMAAVREHRGSKATQDDIIADRDAIAKVLSDAHVDGTVNVSIYTLGTMSKITFAIEDHGIRTPVTTAVTVLPELDAETFVGNGLIPSATLVSASGLAPGDVLNDARIAAAGKSILAAYKVVNAPIGVSISVATKQLANGKVDLIWQITELRSRECTSSNLNLCNNPFR